MFCEKCGKQIPDNSSFCDGCGAAVPQVNPQAQQTQQAQQEPQQAMYQQNPDQFAPQQPQQPKKPFPENILEKLPPVIRNNIKVVCIAAIGFIVALIALIVILVSLSNNVDLDDYITVTNSGYDKYGKVEYEVDYDALVSEITGDSISNKASLDDWSSLQSAASSATAYYAISGAVDVEVEYPEDKSNGTLSNGDVVKFIMTFDPIVASTYDVDTETVTVEHEIEGLGEAKVFNLMENVGVTFEGYDGAGKATLSTDGFTKTVGGLTFTQDGEYPHYIKYNSTDGDSGSIYIYIDGDSTGLSNGDTVKVVTDGFTAETLSKHGVILEGLSKDYTVEGLASSENYDVMANFEIKTYGVNESGNASIVAKDSSTTVGNFVFTTSADDPDVVRYEDKTNSYNSGYFYIGFDGDRSGLANGDTVKITANVDADRLADYGVILTNLTKETTASGLGSYASKLADIKTESLNELYSKCMEDLKNRLYDDWGDVVHNSWRDFDDQKIGNDLKAYKTIITTPKNTASSDKNTLWLVMSVTLKDDSMEEDTVYYFYYAFKNIAVDADGNLSYSDDYTPNKSYGYTSYDDMYDDRIEAFNLNIEVSK